MTRSGRKYASRTAATAATDKAAMRDWLANEEPREWEYKDHLQAMCDEWVRSNTFTTVNGEERVPTIDNERMNALVECAKRKYWEKKRQDLMVCPNARATLKARARAINEPREWYYNEHLHGIDDGCVSTLNDDNGTTEEAKGKKRKYDGDDDEVNGSKKDLKKSYRHDKKLDRRCRGFPLDTSDEGEEELSGCGGGGGSSGGDGGGGGSSVDNTMPLPEEPVREICKKSFATVKDEQPETEECFMDNAQMYSVRIGYTRNKNMRRRFRGIIMTRHQESGLVPAEKDFEYLHPLSTLEDTVQTLHYLNYRRGQPPIKVPDYKRFKVPRNADGSLNFASDVFVEVDHDEMPPNVECYVDRKKRYSLRIGLSTRLMAKKLQGIIFTRYPDPEVFPPAKPFEYLHPLWSMPALVRALHYLHYIETKGEKSIVPQYGKYGNVKDSD